MCQSIGNLLGLYETNHPQFEGLIKELHNQFWKLRNQGKIDSDRIEEDEVIKLLDGLRHPNFCVRNINIQCFLLYGGLLILVTLLIMGYL